MALIVVLLPIKTPQHSILILEVLESSSSSSTLRFAFRIFPLNFNYFSLQDPDRKGQAERDSPIGLGPRFAAPPVMEEKLESDGQSEETSP